MPECPAFSSAVWNPVSAESRKREIPFVAGFAAFRIPLERQIPQVSGILEGGTSRTAGHAGMTVGHL